MIWVKRGYADVMIRVSQGVGLQCHIYILPIMTQNLLIIDGLAILNIRGLSQTTMLSSRARSITAEEETGQAEV